jgi:ribosomal protein S18 acetylase RimI-like enzyme
LWTILNRGGLNEKASPRDKITLANGWKIDVIVCFPNFGLLESARSQPAEQPAAGLDGCTMIASGVQDSVSYFKRFRMEIDLQEALPAVPALPPGYAWVAWEDRLWEQHAEVKYQCFIEQIDSVVFSSLASRDGCRRLMREITSRSGFKPEATWLIACGPSYCATIQGVRERTGMGAIQNVGVTASHRGRGLGSALVLKSLHGLQRSGAHRAHLEVTAQNDGAVRIYRRLGFRCRKTLYKAVPDPGAPHPGSQHDWLD